MKDDELLTDIERCFPSLAIASWRALGEGWMSRALLVNERYVFRFAKVAQAATDLAKEAALLPAIAERVSLAVPAFELSGKQANGLPFVGYALIAGQPLDIAGLPAAAHTRVAQQLATFMSQLQSVPVELAVGTGLFATNYRREYERDWQALQRFLPKLQPRVAAHVARRFAEFFGCSRFFQNPARLIHADLSPDHLLFDPARCELVGVIDFGDLALGDPDYEYVYLLEDLGTELTARVMAARGESDVPALLHKVGYYVTFDHVRSILSGLERGVAEWLDEGVAALEAETTLHASDAGLGDPAR